MRIKFVVVLMLVISGAKAQVVFPGNFLDYNHPLNSAASFGDSSKQRQWSVSKYAAISSSYLFSKAGGAAILSAPMGVQLNRRLNNNLYAFGNLTVAPSYISLNRSFVDNSFSGPGKFNSSFKTGSMGMYSRAALGLQYVNDDRTFSISGSIGVERSSYPMFPYYQQNNNTNQHFLPAGR